MNDIGMPMSLIIKALWNSSLCVFAFKYAEPNSKANHQDVQREAKTLVPERNPGTFSEKQRRSKPMMKVRAYINQWKRI